MFYIKTKEYKEYIYICKNKINKSFTKPQKKPLLTALAQCFPKDLYNAISFYVIIINETC